MLRLSRRRGIIFDVANSKIKMTALARGGRPEMPLPVMAALSARNSDVSL